MDRIAIWKQGRFLSQVSCAWHLLREFVARYEKPISVSCLLFSIGAVICFFIKTPPSGVAIAVLGAVAVFMALRGELHGSEKVVWTVVVFLLLFIEIRAINTDRTNTAKDQDSARATEQDHFSTLLQISQNTQATISGYLRTQQLAVQANAQRFQGHKVSDQLMELKSRVANLSSGIFELLFNRQIMAPPPPRSSTWEQDIARIVPFDSETVLLYDQKYGADVLRAIEDLEKAGISDPMLKNLSQGANVLAVRITAEHLAAQAERITPDGIKPLSRLLRP
jgi:hypothetical protein